MYPASLSVTTVNNCYSSKNKKKESIIIYFLLENSINNLLPLTKLNQLKDNSKNFSEDENLNIKLLAIAKLIISYDQLAKEGYSFLKLTKSQFIMIFLVYIEIMGKDPENLESLIVMLNSLSIIYEKIDIIRNEITQNDLYMNYFNEIKNADKIIKSGSSQTYNIPLLKKIAFLIAKINDLPSQSNLPYLEKRKVFDELKTQLVNLEDSLDENFQKILEERFRNAKNTFLPNRLEPILDHSYYTDL